MFKRVVGDARPDIPSESGDNIVGSYQPFISASGELIFQAFILSSSVDKTTKVATGNFVVPPIVREHMRSNSLSKAPFWVYTESGRVNNQVTKEIHIAAAKAFQQIYNGRDTVLICDNLNSHRQPDLLSTLYNDYGQTVLFTPPNLTHLYGICDDILFASLSKTFAEKRSKISFSRSLLGKKDWVGGCILLVTSITEC